MDIETLSLFSSVMRLRSFTASARLLDLDPSIVSRRIAELERELGFRLFQRTTRKLLPTEAGQRYFARIAPLLAEIMAAKEEGRDLLAHPNGWIKVTASVAFGEAILAPLISEFQEIYPDLFVELLLSDSTLDIVSEGIDVAIRLGTLVAHSELVVSKLINTRYHLCASPQYLVKAPRIKTPNDIVHHRCLASSLPDFRSLWKFRNRQGQQIEIPIEPVLVTSNAMALRRAAMTGAGIALLADWLIDADIAKGDLVSLLPQYRVTATNFDTAAWIFYPNRAYLPLKVRVFIDFLKRYVKQNSKLISSSPKLR